MYQAKCLFFEFPRGCIRPNAYFFEFPRGCIRPNAYFTSTLEDVSGQMLIFGVLFQGCIRPNAYSTGFRVISFYIP